MTQSTRHELISDAFKRYKSAGKPDKSLILDELQLYTGYHRKYLLRAFRKLSGTPKVKKNKPRAEPPSIRLPVSLSSSGSCISQRITLMEEDW